VHQSVPDLPACQITPVGLRKYKQFFDLCNGEWMLISSQHLHHPNGTAINVTANNAIVATPSIRRLRGRGR